MDIRQGSAASSDNSCGTTLIEVLVTLVIAATALLGAASLQSISTQYNQRAHLRNQAISQGNDIIDRMRANPAAITASGYLRASPGAGTGVRCAVNTCTPEQMAAADLTQWERRNRSLLPDGSGTVSRLGPDVVRVLMQWRDAGGDDANPRTQRIDMRHP